MSQKRGSPQDLGSNLGAVGSKYHTKIGRMVIADSVNSLRITRDAWVQVATRAQVSAVEIEVTCSDANEHQRRAETRITDIPGLRLPTWKEVVSREYDSWDRDHLVVDTMGRTLDENVNMLRELLASSLVQASLSTNIDGLPKRNAFDMFSESA